MNARKKLSHFIRDIILQLVEKKPESTVSDRRIIASATCSPSGAEKGAQSHCKGRGTEEEGYRGCGGVRWG